MAKRRIVTLLTDFGMRDGYVGCMKGVLLSSADVDVVDISHDIAPGDVLAGAFVLNQVYDYFPTDTVHVVVVDPGVGTDRRILAARYAGRNVVCPDNGLLTFVDSRYGLEGIASVRNEQYFLRNRVGRTFDGRDVMAPVAMALASGVSLSQLGPQPDRYKLLELHELHFDGQAMRGRVVFIDRFGNCVTNIDRATLTHHLPRLTDLTIWAKDRQVGPLQGTFQHVPTGQALALLNSMDLLEIAVNNGSASDEFALSVGDEVKILPAHKRMAGPAKLIEP